MLSLFRSLLRNSTPNQLVSAIKDQTGSPDMAVSLHRLKSKGFAPGFILDVGAYMGWWSEMARSAYPQAQILMVEPLPGHAELLSALAARLKVSYARDVCGARLGEKVPFHIGSIGSSIYSPKRFTASDIIELQTTTLDSLLEQNAWPRADLIKIDVQGAEEEVLKGGEKALIGAEAVIMELSIVNSYDKGLLAGEMISVMQDKGFLLYDIAGLNRANRTRSVNEFDAVFVKRNSPLWDIKHFLPHDAPEQ